MVQDEVTYTLTAINNSTNSTNICVFQQDPNIGVSNVCSLAWFSKYAYQGTTVNFSWKLNYNFVWSVTGELKPGIPFNATQAPVAGLQNNNQISLDYDPIHDAYFFTPSSPITAPPSGILRILETDNIPLKKASVGIGMDGKGTFVVEAQPNLTLNFTPHPKYYILAGNFTQGQVLDISETTAALEVSFDKVYQMTAILNEDNIWSIKSTLEVNKRFLELRKTNHHVKWGSLY
ncbi:hypothetical protein [Nostoc linckia]|nr:hypothetical protein [Nostoc linckia]